MILLDSPGFDGNNRTDIDVLKMIGLHLQQGAKENKFLTGVIYIQNITDSTMSGSALNNHLRILRQLCGADHYAHIALVTSHWDLVGPAEGKAHEEQLCTGCWADMIGEGATVHRHTNTKESAIEILRRFLPESPFELPFQKEFSVHGNVGDTAAGRVIVQILLGKLGECRAEILRLTEDNLKAKSENERMRGDIQVLRADIDRLKLENDREKERERDRRRDIDRLKLESDRERERERDRRRDIQQTLGLKQKLIDQANTAREKVEREIAGLKAEIDKLKLEKEKENSLKEDLKSKQKLIDQANTQEKR
jgi:hypothetical protein